METALARVARDDVLASPVRAQIYERILGKPGITVTELASSAEVHWGAASFHLARLMGAGLVRSTRVGRRRLVFPVSATDGTWAEELSLLAEPSCFRLAAAVAEMPGKGVMEYAERAALTPRTAYHHLKNLVEVGLVERQTARRYHGLRATALLYTLLAERQGGAELE